MAKPTHTQSTYNEANIVLAIQALDRGQIKSVRQAASTFHVPRSTLQTRRAGALPQRDFQPKSKKLNKLEEEAVVSHILDLDSRGFPPTIGAVRAMADRLLATRQVGPVGQKWPFNFVKRTPSLKTRFNRPYDDRELYARTLIF